MDRQGSRVGFGGWITVNAAHLRAIRLAADGSSGSANELRNQQPSALNPQPPRGWSVPSFHQMLISVIPNNLTHFC